MPKHTLEDLDDVDDSTLDAGSRRKKVRRGSVDAILENGKKTLFRAMKVGRGFERQKLGRRQKLAEEQTESMDTIRLAGEVAALKGLDLLAISEIHLYKSLLKSKPIATNSAFPTYIAAKVRQHSEPPNIATANVTARLYNSNPVKAAVTDILANVHEELGIAPDEVPRKKKRLRAADYARQSVPSTKAQKTAQAAESDATSRGGAATEFKASRPISRSISAEDQSAPSSDSQSIDLGQYESRLADSGGESDESGPGSLEKIGDIDRESQESSDEHLARGIVALHNKSQPLSYQPSGSLSPSPSSSLSPSPSDSSSHQFSDLRSAPTLKVPSTTKQPTKQTTFLPSLIGGYWSGSDSAPDDEEVSGVKPRKNRRGQQERRAIWEKKYGRAAKHLHGQPQSKQQSRDEGWDARRGASDGRGKRGRGRGGKRTSRDGVGGGRPSKDFASGANGETMGRKRTIGSVEAKQKQNDGPLHPSWEAKKKAKEKAGSSVVQFQGKKVVFD